MDETSEVVERLPCRPITGAYVMRPNPGKFFLQVGKYRVSLENITVFSEARGGGKFC